MDDIQVQIEIHGVLVDSLLALSEKLDKSSNTFALLDEHARYHMRKRDEYQQMWEKFQAQIEEVMAGKS